MKCRRRWAWVLAACVAAAGRPGRCDEPAPSPETRAALDEIQREADQRRAEREEMQRLRREVDRRAQARRQAAGRRRRAGRPNVMAMRPGAAMPGAFAFGPRGPVAVRTFRTPQGGGFVAFWGW